MEQLNRIETEAYGGFVARSDAHLFYKWATDQNLLGAGNIDGVTLLELYEKNVLETGMSEERFEQYCIDSGFPHYDAMEYDEFDVVSEEYWTSCPHVARQEYEKWAAEKDIPTTEGSRMIFRTKADAVVLVFTDTELRGNHITHRVED